MNFNLEEFDEDGADIPEFIERHDASLRFPEKLMLLLLFVERSLAKAGRSIESACITWTRDGKAFVIRNEDELVQHIFPRIFRQTTKFGSFTRELHEWGFRQLNDKPHDCTEDVAETKRPLVFANENFQRDNKKLLANMQSVSASKKDTTSIKTDPGSVASMNQSPTALATSKPAATTCAPPAVASLDSSNHLQVSEGNLLQRQHQLQQQPQPQPQQDEETATFVLPTIDLTVVVTRSRTTIWSTTSQRLLAQQDDRGLGLRPASAVPSNESILVVSNDTGATTHAALQQQQQQPQQQQQQQHQRQAGLPAAAAAAAAVPLSSSVSSSSSGSSSPRQRRRRRRRRRRMNQSSPPSSMLQQFLARPVVLPVVDRREQLLFDIAKAVQIVSGIGGLQQPQQPTTTPTYNPTIG